MNWLKRYWFYFVIVGLVAVIAGTMFYEYFKVFIGALFFCVIGEFVAVVLSELSLYAYTRLMFTKQLIYGDDELLSDEERAKAIEFAGKVFVGVHLLVGLIIAGVYFVYVS